MTRIGLDGERTSSGRSQNSSRAGAGHEVEQPTPPPVVATDGVDTDPLPVYLPPRRATPRATVSGGWRATR